MRQWLMDDDLFAIGSYGPPSINKTIQGSWIRYMVGSTSSMNVGIQSLYSTSTLSTFLGNALFAYDTLLNAFSLSTVHINGISTVQEGNPDLLARYDLSFRSGEQEIATRKPVVEVECSGFPPNASSFTFPHDRMIWPPWTSDPIASTDWTVAASNYSNIDLNSTLANASWIDIKQFGSIKPSLGAIFTTPETFSTRKAQYSFYACTIDARWMSTRAFYDASSGHAAIFDSNPDPQGVTVSYYTGTGPVPEAIPSVYLSDSWAKALDVPWNDVLASPESNNRSMLDIIGQKCLDQNTFFNASLFGTPFPGGGQHRILTDPMKMLGCLQVVLSIYITDALARVQEPIPTYFVANGRTTPYDSSPKDFFLVQNIYDGIVQSSTGLVKNITEADFKDTSRFLEMHIDTSRWGYGYGFEDSTLIYVATIVLLLDVAFALAYLVWILIMGEFEKWAWESIDDLVTIAMRSGSADLYDGNEISLVVDDITSKNKRIASFVVKAIPVLNSDKNSLLPEKQLVLRRVIGRS